MNIVMRNLPGNILLLHKALEEIIKDIQIQEDPYDPPNSFVTVAQFCDHYPDLVGPSAIRKRLKKHKEYFKEYCELNGDGMLHFCPYRMLEHLERNSPNWVIKNRCQQYLHDLDECDL